MAAVRLYTLAFMLMGLSLPLISVGSVNDIQILWVLGFVMLLVGALIPPTVRYTLKQSSPISE